MCIIRYVSELYLNDSGLLYSILLQNFFTTDLRYHSPLSERQTAPCANHQRVDYLQKMCIKHPPKVTPDMDNPNTYYRLMLDETHKLIYCVIPKNGCTSMKMLLKETSHEPKAMTADIHNLVQMGKLAGLPMMKHLPITNIKQKLESKEYLKFLIVRHPFDRLLSAYKNKFIDEIYSPPLYKEIISKLQHRKMANISSEERPTWEEFVSYLPENKSKDNSHSNNIHWRRQVDLCYPCQVKYDLVMKLETIDVDSEPVIDRLAGDIAKFKRQGLGRRQTSNASVKTNTEFSKLTDGLVDKLKRRYEEDFRLFGYSYSQDGHANCEIRSDEKACC